ncbi:MAG TPA: pirin family protein [Chitinophagaceae bacterium]|nr:pirin family protein [Chitinophagaceae bacterium]
MKKIKAIHKAVYEPIGNLVTYRALPANGVAMNQLDPFIFLNHHGFQQYPPHNNGLPFGPHPHRGFETVTFILQGDLMHKDSSGGGSIISAGGVQWMTAGKGLIHAEISSEEFKQKGGPLEILQLWINLPAKYKMVPPKYIGLQQKDIPTQILDNGKTKLSLISGTWGGIKGIIEPLVDISLATVHFREIGTLKINIQPQRTPFFYVVKGELEVNGKLVAMHHLIEFERSGEVIEVKANTEAIILLGHAEPFNEPFVAYGPFVMNTKEEIQEAYKEYNEGKFGDPDAF